MGRKRKIQVIDEEKENEDAGVSTVQKSSNNSIMLHGPMYTIMSNVQLNESLHKKYIKEMKHLYAKMDHEAFMFTFVRMVKSAMEAEENNEFASNTLQFCAQFVSSFESEETHPVLTSIFNWLLSTISSNPHIRFRLCQFVNKILSALGHEAALDDAICDRILEYMLDRLRDMSITVRYQAILALQRLQQPTNPDDPVVRAYQFHLCSDPSPRVRVAVISCMGRNALTLPSLLERLWDIDEKVRRHIYVHLSSYSVHSYKVAQRITLLECGLNDRSESVRKVVHTILLKQWVESYKLDLISFIEALKLDSKDEELERFRKVTKQTLSAIFKQQNSAVLIECLPIEEDGELHRCVPFEKLTLEVVLYWQALAEYFQETMAEEIDVILPELSVFCAYVEAFCQAQRANMDPFQKMIFQHKLLLLIEILCSYDLGDEIGRGNLQKLIVHLLTNYNINEKIIKVIVKCAENLMPNQATRMQFFIDIVRDLCCLNSGQNFLVHDRDLINELLALSSDSDLNLKLSSLKVKILELEEQEMNYIQRKDYVRAQQKTDERNAATEEYTNLLKPLLEKYATAKSVPIPSIPKVPTMDDVQMGLQIIFHMVVSPKVKCLNPNVCQLYNDFICRHLAANQITVRYWALSCATAFSMLYEVLAKDVFKELYTQFYKNHRSSIWILSVNCIFELIERYGIETFTDHEEQQANKTGRNGRILYRSMDSIGSEDDEAPDQDGGIIYGMSRMLNNCVDNRIKGAVTKGFCRLILRGLIDSRQILEKLLLQYFNPVTDPEINQLLGVFLEHLIQSKRRGLLENCIVPTVQAVINAPYDNPLRDIKPETIARFYIDATREVDPSSKINVVHNKLALKFVDEMLKNVSNKELCKMLARELTVLDVNVMQNEELKEQLLEKTEKLISSDFDPKTKRHFINFKEILNGVYKHPPQNADDLDTDDDESKDEDRHEISSREQSTEKGQERGTTPTVRVMPTVVEENLTESSETENRTLITSDKDSNVEASPIFETPTTYGEANTVRHRSLRRSVNASQNSNTPADVQPSGGGDADNTLRPTMIRIEARIDSDEKKKQVKGGPQTSMAVKEQNQLNAKRALRYPRRNAESNAVPSSSDNKNKNTETDSDSDTRSSDNEEEQPKSQSEPEPKSVRQLNGLNEGIRMSRRLVRSNPRYGGGKDANVTPTRAAKTAIAELQRKSNSKTPITPSQQRKSRNNLEMSDNEVIPASPRQEGSYLKTRRQKAIFENSLLRQTRSKSQNSYESINTNGHPSPSMMQRKSHKRSHQNSPIVSALRADQDTASPLRKQSRLEHRIQPATLMSSTRVEEQRVTTETLQARGNSRWARSKSFEMPTHGRKRTDEAESISNQNTPRMTRSRKRDFFENKSISPARKRRRRNSTASIDSENDRDVDVVTTSQYRAKASDTESSDMDFRKTRTRSARNESSSAVIVDKIMKVIQSQNPRIVLTRCKMPSAKSRHRHNTKN